MLIDELPVLVSDIGVYKALKLLKKTGSQKINEYKLLQVIYDCRSCCRRNSPMPNSTTAGCGKDDFRHCPVILPD